MFLVHPTLTQAEVDRVCEVVRWVAGGALFQDALLNKAIFDSA
jgi:hypothetical protein